MPGDDRNFIGSLIDELVLSSDDGQTSSEGIVDIITFCEDPRFLNMGGQSPPMHLWGMQKIVLKLFYRGSRGNEHLSLTEDERRLLHEIDKTETLDYDQNKGGFRQIVEKYDRATIHTTLLLVMGRRSSKTLMVSIIAAYEAYKLVELKNPHEYYSKKGVEIAAGKPIAILNVAVSAKQAYDPLFLEIESRITRSPYFRDKVNYPVCRKDAIYLLTEADREEMRRREREGVDMKVEGSVVLMSGHSNSNSLRGKAAIAILFDEYAHFIQTDGRTSGDEAYRALVPSTKQFGDDGRIVLLSDPKGKDGMFWRLFQMSTDRELDEDGRDQLDENGDYTPKHDKILALQIPTWRMNPTKDLSREVLEEEEKPKDPVSFACTYGARFLGEEGVKFFDEKKITSCIDFSVGSEDTGDPKYVYHIHLDPATTSHNYALAMVHAVTFSNQYQQVKRKVFLDLLKFWTPTEDGPVDINEVQSTVIALCRKFRVVTVTFDQWQSAQTIQNLRNAGINAFETKFVTGYLTTIYGELKTLVNLEDVVLYPNYQLIGEMKNLKYKLLRSGFRRFFDPESEFPSDDCCDALAGAVYQSLYAQVRQSLPRGAVVWTGRR
jgi:hypothetical protein